jgi:hypothetical protein
MLTPLTQSFPPQKVHRAFSYTPPSSSFVTWVTQKLKGHSCFFSTPFQLPTDPGELEYLLLR